MKYFIGTLIAVLLLSVAPAGAVTLPPALVSPADSSAVTSTVNISYTLPEAPLANSVILSITDGPDDILCAITMNDSLSNSFVLDLNNILASPAVVSAFGCDDIPNGTGYNFIVGYQNLLADPLALDSATNVSIGVSQSTSAPTTSAPVAQQVAANETAALPETGTDTELLFLVSGLSVVFGGILVLVSKKLSKKTSSVSN